MTYRGCVMKFKFRELTEQELVLVSGGQYTGPEVNVLGKRPNPIGATGVQNNGWASEDGPSDIPIPDCDSTDINWHNGENPIDNAAFSESVRETINKIIKAMASELKKDDWFSASAESLAYGKELMELAVRADIDIISDAPTNNTPSGVHGSAGYAIRNNGDPIFQITKEGLEGYAAWGEVGITYYFLHELAHVTQSGFDKSNAMGNSITASEYRLNEQWANDMAKAIAQAIGMPIDRPVNGAVFEPMNGYGPYGATTGKGTGESAGTGAFCH